MVVKSELVPREFARRTAFSPTADIDAHDVQEAIEEVFAAIPAASSADVVGPASSTDEALARFNGATGKLLQNSVVTVTDAGIMNGAVAVGVNATADLTNRLSVNSAAVLFNHEGAGTQIKVNKNAAANTASYLFQTAFSGRAEFGLIADDDFTLKTSPDGSAFTTALIADNATGALRVGVNLRPAANDGAALGSTTVGWADLFGATGWTLNIANGNWLATHSSGIMTVTTGDLRVTSAGTNAASAVTVGGTQTLTNKQLTAATVNTSLNPTANDGAALGSTALGWSDVFLASGGVINWNNGTVTLTQSSSSLLMSGASATFQVLGTGNSGLEIGRIDGTLSTPFIDFHSGATAVDYDSRLIASGGTGVSGAGTLRVFAADFSPGTNDATSLGTGTQAFSDLFLGSGGVVNWNNSNYTITHSAGDLAFSGIVTLPNTGLHLLDTNASHDLIVVPGSNLTADRTLTVTTGDTNITLNLTDPGADRLMFWDDSASTWRDLTLGTGLSITGTTLDSSGSGFTTVVIQVFTATGTYTPTANMKYCIAEVQAPGGGSGGADTAAAGGAAGGGGEYARGVFSAATIGASQAVTIGAVGTAGANTGTAGGTGGTTSLGALLTAIGGSGGAGSTGARAAGGAGGAGGTGGSFRVPGQRGQDGFTLTDGLAAVLLIGGDGGNAHLGLGAVNPNKFTSTDTAGVAGNNYGGGASGAQDDDPTGSAGATGGPGIIIITEFI